MKLTLGILILFTFQLSEAAVRARAFRQYLRDGVRHEMVFYSKIRANEPPSFEEVATMGFAFTEEEVFKAEILADEDWKFDRFDDDDYLTPERDGILIGSIRSFEALEKHDEILIIKRLEPSGEEWIRRTVGIIAFKYQWPDAENMLFEDRQKIKLQNTPIFSFSEGAKVLPHHWRSYPRMISTHNRKWGGYLQINSVVADKKFKQRYLYDLIAGAYWHGLFTGGPVVTAGEIFLGQPVTETTTFSPIFYVLEGYGRRAKVWSRWDMYKIPMNGVFDIPDFFQPERSFSVMGTDTHSYWQALESYFGTTRGLEVGATFPPTGYLTLYPQYHPIMKLPGVIYADLRSEQRLLSCGIELAEHSLEYGANFPLKGWMPKIRSLR